MGGFEAPPEVNKKLYKKYDTTTSAGLNFYVLAQFMLIVLGLCALMYHFEGMSLFYKWLFTGTIILSTMICGAIFEVKRWVYIAEYLRLVVVLFSLNTYYYFWQEDWFLVMLASSIAAYVGFNFWFTLSALLKPRIFAMSK
jgi:hypothetical protein